MIVYKLGALYPHNIRGPAIIESYDNIKVSHYWIKGKFIKTVGVKSVTDKISDLLECKK